jgi:diguanylate cyclase (GGDEF)-like protein
MNLASKVLKFGMERLFIFLFLLSIVLIILHITVLERRLVFEIDAETNFFEVDITDDSIDGGNSTSYLVRTDSTYIFHYTLKEGAPFPYAAIRFNVAKGEIGIDLNRYDRMRLKISAEGMHSNRIRLFLRNYNPYYSTLADEQSLKYNEIHFPALGLDQALSVDWKMFHVSGWWVAMKDIPFEHSSVEIKNVHMIELMTPESLSQSEGQIEILSIEFYGKMISPLLFTQILLILWVLSFGIFALFRYMTMISKVKIIELRENELLIINENLNVQAKELEQMATHDALTGLLNRYGLKEELNNIHIELKDMGVIFIDLDHFKQINDMYGHERGDYILNQVSELLNKNIRCGDLLARWGGEEFLLFCPNSDLEESRNISEKLRLKIEVLVDKVTCSFGVCCISQAGSIEEAINRADQALYKAKQQGRNRVVTCT